MFDRNSRKCLDCRFRDICIQEDEFFSPGGEKNTDLTDTPFTALVVVVDEFGRPITPIAFV